MRRGFTLVEMMVAVLLTFLVMSGAFALLSSGNQLFTRGLQVASGRQASLLFFDQLEDDVAACIVVPDHQGPPVAIAEDGRTIAFYRVDRAISTLQTTVGKPVDWALSGKPGTDQSPVRNGVALKNILIRDMQFKLIPPDPAQKQFAFLLAVTAQFPEGGIMNRQVRVRRLIELVQPTSVSRYGAFFAPEVTPLSFVMMEAPKPMTKLLESAGLFAGAGPAPKPEGAPSSPPTTGAAVLIGEGTE